ncbi:hypothetical protein [Paraburkholderia phosphatilytica]|uniref:hypothetical protein n=1 Tax=Paraburkholderia phosphatilytica TaxID=2282883 RepID=UPI000E52BCB3|nr:hypothetical protein [Paraburkholderia phosphatilytica]
MQLNVSAGYDGAIRHMTALTHDAAFADDEIDTLERFIRAHQRRVAQLARAGLEEPGEYDALSIAEGRLQRWHLFRARLTSEISAARSD